MYKCEICGREFKNISALVSHISNPNKSCKISIKEYYDKYLRKENEGYCKICGKETGFHSIVKGYKYNICGECKNINPEYIKKQVNSRYKTIKKFKSTKLEKNYHNFNIQCKICHKKFKNYSGLSKHIYQIHKISIEDYYLKYINSNKNICTVCDKETNFDCLERGYYKFHRNCSSKDLVIRKKINKSFKESFKNINQEKRIEKYKETRNKNNEIKILRKKLIFILKILSINKSNKKQCQICGEIFNTYNGIISHIRKHKIDLKKYYDKFFKLENEGVCSVSDLKTNFSSLENGYCQYCKNYQQKDLKLINNNKILQSGRLREKILKYQNNFNIEFINIDKIHKNNDMTNIKCLDCGHIYQNRWYNVILGYGKCPICHPRNQKISSYEIEIYNFIREIDKDIKILTSYFGLIKNKNNKSLELDIYIPEKNIAIEFDGLYWHSEEQGKDKNYHLLKTDECNKKGIRLIHIFEDEWVLKRNICENKLKQILNFNKNINRIHARKCEIKEIDSKLKNEFLNKYHLQGSDSSNIKLGAFYNNELISVMTFSHGNISKGSKNIEGVYELNRFCSNYNYHIPGIASKLLSYFKKNYEWKELYSYADKRWSLGNLYYKLGFELVSESLPEYWYVSNNGIKRIHRFNLRKRPNEPKDITEAVLRSKEGYHRIYDCGHLKFKMIKT